MTSTRAYDSSRRRAVAATTRAGVVAAASRLFAERGWSGTSMRDVAREAGVAVETIYATVGAKAELLKVCIDVAVVGDDEPVPLLERPEFRSVTTGDLERRLATTGRVLGWIYARTAELHTVLVAAAAVDPGLAELLAQVRADQRASFRAALELVARRTPTDTEVDGALAALGNESYLVLTRELGWDREKYETWAADMLRRLLAP